MNFTLAIDAKNPLVETPIWDPRIQKLYWNELFSGRVHRYDPATGQDEWVDTHSTIGAAIPCDVVDKLLVAVDDGMMLLDFPTGKLELICAPQPNTGEFRYNDTRCDSAGRIFTSTVSKAFTEPNFDPKTMTGGFYMVDTDGSVVTLVEKLVQYNTIFFNNANTAMYVVDTYNKKLLKFEYTVEKGAWGAPQEVLQFNKMPDGVCVDVNDNIYVCHWDDAKVISVYSLPDLSLVKEIPFPVRNICCGGFGGSDMKDFYVCTANFWIPEGDPDLAAGAGGIFAARSEVAGTPERFYKIKP